MVNNRQAEPLQVLMSREYDNKTAPDAAAEQKKDSIWSHNEKNFSPHSANSQEKFELLEQRRNMPLLDTVMATGWD